MILASTSNGWNYGDDIIREGVFRLLDVPVAYPCVWLNRCEMTCNGGTLSRDARGKRVHQWECQSNFSLDEIMGSVSAFVEAGTPGWADCGSHVYKMIAKRKIPVFIVGVGSGGRGGLASIISDQIKVATARDSPALKCLRGVTEAEKFFDPALHALWPLPERKNLVILNYRARGGNGRHDEGNDSVYLELFQRHRSEIDVITVHEATEISFARKLFPDTPILFYSEWSDFKEIYSRCKLYIGGRIHGALSVVATGGQAHLLYSMGKKVMIKDLRNSFLEKLGWSPIKLTGVSSDFELETPTINSEELRAFLDDDFERHQRYLLTNPAPWSNKHYS